MFPNQASVLISELSVRQLPQSANQADVTALFEDYSILSFELNYI